MTTIPGEYADLPDWIRPGAQLASVGDSGYEFVTVLRITKTQIVTAPDARPEHLQRYRREPNSGGITPGRHVHVGEYWSPYLAERTDPAVIRMRIERIAQGVPADAQRAALAYRRPERTDRRSSDERALAMFDEIENAVRAARRQIMRLIAQLPQHDDAAAEPGGE